jgi:DNA-binding NarL/FixJ family response regulator
MIRVVLADDQPLVRAGLRVLIADTPDIEAVGEASNGSEAVEQVLALRPDVAVMDIRMPGVDGIEATRLITSDPGSQTHVLVLTTFYDDHYVYAALRAGASGFLVKNMVLESILDGIRTVAVGEALLAPAVTRRLIEKAIGHPEPAPAPCRPIAVDGITDREREVLTLVGRGLSNSQIAEELFITPGTAKTHVARLFTKLDARDRVHLVIIAYELGLVAPTR